MKRSATTAIIIALVLVSFSACGKKAVTPEAGKASADDVLAMLPSDCQGVFFIDVHRIMSTEMVNKAIQEDENYQKYQEFVQKTGLDPKSDVYFAAVGVMEAAGAEKQKGVAVVNLKYDPETMLALLKEKMQEEGVELPEETYGEHTLFTATSEDEPISFSFIDDSNIVAGNNAPVKAVLDVIDKKKDNIYKNDALTPLLDQANKEAMFWGAMLIPQEAMEKAASENPMLGALKSVHAVALYFDYKANNILAEIKLMSADEEGNKQVAEALTGIKSFAGMAAAERPEIGELMQKIEISSAADHVKVFANIPEELIEKLSPKPETKQEQEEKE